MLFRLVIILFVLLSTTAYAVEYTYEQKLRRGEITEQKFTTCRLAAKKTFGKTRILREKFWQTKDFQRKNLENYGISEEHF